MKKTQGKNAMIRTQNETFVMMKSRANCFSLSTEGLLMKASSPRLVGRLLRSLPPRGRGTTKWWKE